MKNRYLPGSLLAICLLLAGCGAADNDTDMLQSESERELTALRTVPGENIGGTGMYIFEDIFQSALQEAGNKAYRIIPSGCDYALAYYGFLVEYAKESKYIEMERAKFSLAFIDDDEVPELLVFEDNSHAAGVDVYTYYQDEVTELGEFGSSGEMQYVERGGMIFSNFTGMGEAFSMFFRLDEGTADLVNSLHSRSDYEGWTYVGDCYEIDGVIVSEEIFEAKWDELYRSHEYVLIGYEDGIAIKEEEIATLLMEAINNLYQ